MIASGRSAYSATLRDCGPVSRLVSFGLLRDAATGVHFPHLRGISMHRSVVVIVVALVFSSVARAQPARLLGCDDWTFTIPGLSCSSFASSDDCQQEPSPPFCSGWNDYQGEPDRPGLSRATDNSGALYLVRRTSGVEMCGSVRLGRLELLRRTESGAEVVAFVADRCEAPDCVVFGYQRYTSLPFNVIPGPSTGYLNFDDKGGRFLIPMESHVWRGRDDCPSGGQGIVGIVAISGFASTFEVLQSYASPSGRLGYRVPYMPEGMSAADRFDTYWGNVTRPLDLSQAHPLRCAYPDHQPQVGEYLTYADAAPTPSPGQAVYYQTSVTHQGQTRAGRQAIGGRLEGRDASRLPACVVEKEVKR